MSVTAAQGFVAGGLASGIGEAQTGGPAESSTCIGDRGPEVEAA
jgi:hypothetical protein